MIYIWVDVTTMKIFMALQVVVLITRWRLWLMIIYVNVFSFQLFHAGKRIYVYEVHLVVVPIRNICGILFIIRSFTCGTVEFWNLSLLHSITHTWSNKNCVLHLIMNEIVICYECRKLERIHIKVGNNRFQHSVPFEKFSWSFQDALHFNPQRTFTGSQCKTSTSSFWPSSWDALQV